MYTETEMDRVVRHHADGITTITLNRPASANAIDLATARDLRALVRDISADTQVVALLGADARFWGLYGDLDFRRSD
ncbi:enoyl-CoA hydratase/isomerase family protein [Streptomyces sp. GC420]|uniref:enoyl-CoA hydratase/isomerase family protein n=1 Tax=Streptomyces sp. GC420 TaxID=2697568 RepID=UPI00141526A0|nr:enoyl-CoA hydratase/isomerase family protein [Streptomyces sp. GC420]NBM14219.1 hypothetical protein [Streptomyces sp. GC420]